MCKLLSENFTYAGLTGSLYECQPENLKDIIAHKDFYIRKALDTKHAQELSQSLKEGEDLPPVVICTVKEIAQKRIINGNHTAYAHLITQKPVKVLDLGELPFESAFKLQAQLNHQGKILAIKPEDIKHYAQLLYKSFRSEVLGKRDRNTAIQKVALILSKSERHVYRYLEELLSEEDKELRKRALELFRQEHKTQTEIAQILGIDVATISRWLSEDANNSQEKTSTKRFCIFDIMSNLQNLKPSLNNLNEEFLKLLNTYFEGGNIRLTGFYDWAKERGYGIDKEEWDEFRRQVEFALRRVLILNIRKTDKEIKLLMERELQIIPRPAREWIIGSYWELAGPRMLKEAKAFQELIREVCEDIEVEDILGELRKRVEKRDLVYVRQNFNLFVAVFEDVINECKEKYPVLRFEEIEDRLETLLEFESKEEIEKELKAEYVGYRIPKALIEEIWKKKEERVKESLLQKARAIEDYREFKDWLNSLQGLEREIAKELSEIKQIEKALKEKYEKEVIDKLTEEIRGLKHMDYASLVDSLSEEDKDVAIRYRRDLERVFAELERPKAEDVEKLIEEGLSDEDIISHFRTAGLYLSVQELSKIKHSYLKRKEEELRKIEEERKRKEEELRRREEEIKRMEEEVKEEMEEEEDTQKGIGLKGIARKLETLLKLAKQVQEWQEKVISFADNPEELAQFVKKTKKTQRADKIVEEIEELLEKIEYTIQREQERRVENTVYRAIALINKAYERYYGRAFLFSGSQAWGKYARLLQYALEEYRAIDRETYTEEGFLKAVLAVFLYYIVFQKQSNFEGILARFPHEMAKLSQTLDSNFRTAYHKTYISPEQFYSYVNEIWEEFNAARTG